KSRPRRSQRWSRLARRSHRIWRSAPGQVRGRRGGIAPPQGHRAIKLAGTGLHALQPRHVKVRMNIHEYQAKAVLREFGVPVPRGHAAFSVEEAVKAASDLAAPLLVVKAQIHAGGRGKAGGVKLVKS